MRREGNSPLPASLPDAARHRSLSKLQLWVRQAHTQRTQRRIRASGWTAIVPHDTEMQKPHPHGTPIAAKIARNSLANLARMGSSWIIVLLLPPLLVRVLDKPAYATWVLILQVSAYIALVDGGIQSAIARFVARAEELRDYRSMGQSVTSAGVVLVAAALLAALATAICAWQLPNIFHAIPPAIVADARWGLLIIGLSVALILPVSTFAGTFIGLQRNHVNAWAGSLGKLAGAAGIAWAAWRHQGIIAMAAWAGFGNVLQAAIYLIAWERLKIERLVARANATRAAVREFLTFCYSIFAGQLGSLLITGMDMPVVAAFDFPAAAYYAIAATASNMLIVPQGAIVSTLMPVASGISAVQTPERMGELLLRTTRYATAILCLLTIPLVAGMYPLLRLWAGLDYARHALVLAEVLIVAQFIRLTLLPYAAVGLGVGQQQRMLISPLGEGLVNLACSIVLAHFYGAIGVAAGTLVGSLCGVLLHFFNSMPRTDLIRFSRRRLLWTGILRPMLFCLPAALLAILALRHLSAAPVQFSAIAAAELFAALALWWMNFSGPERRQMAGLLRWRNG